MKEKFIYRKYKTEFKFNNLLYTHFKSKFYQKRNNKLFKNTLENTFAKKKLDLFYLKNYLLKY